MRVVAQANALARVRAEERVDEPPGRRQDRLAAARVEIVECIAADPAADEEVPIVLELAVQAVEIVLAKLQAAITAVLDEVIDAVVDVAKDFSGIGVAD